MSVEAYRIRGGMALQAEAAHSARIPGIRREWRLLLDSDPVAAQ